MGIVKPSYQIASLYRHYATVGALFCYVSTSPLWAAGDDQPELMPLDQQVMDHQSQSKQVFATLPGMHFSPKEHRFLFSLGLSHTDIAAANNTHPRNSQKLKLQGSNLSPFIGISGRMFGGGISGDLSENHSHYLDEAQGINERGIMQTNGAGFHVFMNPTPDSKLAFLTFVAGFKTLRADHRARSYGNQVPLAEQEEGWQRIKYEAYRAQIGAHFNLRVFESFALIPWANYIHTQTPKLDDMSKDDELTHRQRYQGDAHTFLGKGSRNEYGIDAAIRLKNFEIHFGNLIGAVLAHRENKNSDVNDRSFAVSLTFATSDRRSP